MLAALLRKLLFQLLAADLNWLACKCAIFGGGRLPLPITQSIVGHNVDKRK
jgi:hypothetical protein